jgi:hypothetical protein
LQTELEADVFTHTYTGLTNGETYYYQLSAVNAVGEGPLSDEVHGTPIGVPSIPGNLTITPGDGEITISWDPPPSDGGSEIMDYRIYRGTSPGDMTLLTELDNDTFTYIDTDLVNGETYYYQISAVNAAGEGANTTEKSGIPMAAGEPEKGFLQEFWWVLVLIILFVIIALVAIFLLWRKGEEEDFEEEFEETEKLGEKVEDAPPSVPVAKVNEVGPENAKGKMPSPEAVKAGERIEAKAKTPVVPRKVVKKPVQKVYQKRKVVKKPKETEVPEAKEKE